MVRLLILVAIALLIISVRTLVVGYDSYTPLVFAEMYIGIVTIVATVPVFRRFSNSPAGDHLVLVFVSGVVAAYYFGVLGRVGGGDTYCGGDYLLSDFARVPAVYRCSSDPLRAAGWLAGLWMAVWTVEWWSKRVGADADRNAAVQLSLFRTAGSLIVVGLLIVAVGALFAGTRSFTTVVLAQTYVLLFALFVAAPTAIRAEETAAGWFMLLTCAAFGAVLAYHLAPRIDGPNACVPLSPSWRVMRDNMRDMARILGAHVPAVTHVTVYRCTPVPFTLVGGFVGWWIAFFASGRRKEVVPI